MRLTEEAILQAINYTNVAQQDLQNNLNYMRSSTVSMLNEWHDANVSRFLEELELFDSYVQVTSQNMEEVKSILRSYISFIEQYNSY